MSDTLTADSPPGHHVHASGFQASECTPNPSMLLSPRTGRPINPMTISYEAMRASYAGVSVAEHPNNRGAAGRTVASPACAG